MADIEIRFGHLDAISSQAICLTEETFYPYAPLCMVMWLTGDARLY
jgi:hypothetical protein